jgi:hypothetical protein
MYSVILLLSVTIRSDGGYSSVCIKYWYRISTKLGIFLRKNSHYFYKAIEVRVKVVVCELSHNTSLLLYIYILSVHYVLILYFVISTISYQTIMVTHRLRRLIAGLHRGGPISITVKSMWDFWRTKW